MRVCRTALPSLQNPVHRFDSGRRLFCTFNQLRAIYLRRFHPVRVILRVRRFQRGTRRVERAGRQGRPARRAGDPRRLSVCESGTRTEARRCPPPAGRLGALACLRLGSGGSPRRGRKRARSRIGRRPSGLRPSRRAPSTGPNASARRGGGSEGQPTPVVASAPAGLGRPPSRGPPPLSARGGEYLSGGSAAVTALPPEKERR